MIKPRLASPLALALCLTPPLGACERDEPATYLPKSGNWVYAETTVVNNTCSENYATEGLDAFALDYDEGDSFQIELGEDDVSCEIDGTEFYCSEYELFSLESDEYLVTIYWTVHWEGTFSSSTEAEGEEVVRVTCVGDDCNLLKDLPCARTAKFEATAL